MRVVSATKAKAGLEVLMEQVSLTHEPMILCRAQGNSVLISEED